MKPIQAKGGILAVIPKKNDQTRAANFRGIMLLPSVYKRLHALLREKVIQVIEPLKPAGQIGGFRGQQVQFGPMSLQCLGRIAKHHQLSMAVVFVDLANAFHRLIRELVCGIAHSDDVAALTEALTNADCSAVGVTKWLEFPCLLERLGAPRMLVQLLRDVHVHTWHVLSAKPGITRTRRGTRPGSPLADVIFHVAMLDITIELNEWVAAQQEYQDLLQMIDAQIEAVVWSDDLALAWLTQRADELPAAIERLLQQIFKVFSRRGFDLNMQKGKTTAVVAFRGPGAPDLRCRYQLSSSTATGMYCQLTPTNICWLHFAPAYKHLGTFFAADGGFQVEVRHRIGLALSAFSQLSKPVLCNRHIALRTRLRLFHALIGTKLFFGLGSWPTPSPKHLEKLNAVVARCLRKILGLVYHQDQVQTTTAQVFALAECLDARARLAQDRLLLAQKLFQHGPAFVHHLLHIEHSKHADSWLHGVFADLRWLHQLDPSRIPLHWTHDLTEPIEYWQSGGAGWKATLRKLGRRHILQESMMTEVHGWHRKIFQVLEQAGGAFSNRPSVLTQDAISADFQCFCGRAFTTAVGLATHQRKQHQIFSPEHAFLTGATCPACLKHFWTTQRLQQHLAYVSRRSGRNDCFQTLMKAGFQGDYTRVTMPSTVEGLNRVNWVPAYGPPANHPDIHISAMVQCEEEIADLEHRCRAPEAPNSADAVKQTFCDQLHEHTCLWFHEFQAADYDADAIMALSDRWLEVIACQLESDPGIDKWLERCFLLWGQTALGDIVSSFEDGEAESIVEDEFACFAQEFSTTTDQTRLSFLRQRLQMLIDTHHDFPHRAVRRSQRKRTLPDLQNVVMKFEDQATWHDTLRLITWEQCMPTRHVPRLLRGGEPHFVVVHLFSGRRREFDVHHWLAQWATHRGLRITILSMDTAVSQEYGNLSVEKCSWGKLVELYEAGVVSATLAGAPCETFSAARHLPPPDTGGARCWPRPLRSAARLFGLAQLTIKELGQCRQGSAFSLQTLYTAALHLAHGGLFLSEHPACPDDEAKASIWRSALVGLLCQEPECNLQTFPQWKWGSATPKPTGLFSVRLPYLARSMYSCSDPELPYPMQIARGLDHSGQFRTAACKEYPPLFCKALARAFTDQFEVVLRARTVIPRTMDRPALHQWVHEAAVESAQVLAFTTYRPDFQGR